MFYNNIVVVYKETLFSQPPSLYNRYNGKTSKQNCVINFIVHHITAHLLVYKKN